MHPGRRRKFELSYEEDEDDESVPLTRSIKVARLAKASAEQVTTAIAEVKGALIDLYARIGRYYVLI